jgi:anti-anti-sigma regulatory factor
MWVDTARAGYRSGVVLEHSTFRDGRSESATPRLSVAFTFDGPRCELSLVGRLDAYSLVALQTQVDQFWLEPFEEVVVRVGGLRQLDDLGVTELARLRELVEGRGGRFRLVGMTEPIPARLGGPTRPEDT